MNLIPNTKFKSRADQFLAGNDSSETENYRKFSSYRKKDKGTHTQENEHNNEERQIDDDNDDDEGEDEIEISRPSRLGLGATYVPHRKLTENEAKLDKKLKYSMRSSKASENNESEANDSDEDSMDGKFSNIGKGSGKRIHQMKYDKILKSLNSSRRGKKKQTENEEANVMQSSQDFVEQRQKQQEMSSLQNKRTKTKREKSIPISSSELAEQDKQKHNNKEDKNKHEHEYEHKHSHNEDKNEHDDGYEHKHKDKHNHKEDKNKHEHEYEHKHKHKLKHQHKGMVEIEHRHKHKHQRKHTGEVNIITESITDDGATPAPFVVKSMSQLKREMEATVKTAKREQEQEQRPKRKKTKTRSRQKNLKRDRRPDHEKPAHLTQETLKQRMEPQQKTTSTGQIS